jgi:hypothetical protein
VTLQVDLVKTKELKLLIDTGAEISIVRGTRLRPGFDYEPTKSIDVKEISDVLFKTEGTVAAIVYFIARNYSLVKHYGR